MTEVVANPTFAAEALVRAHCGWHLSPVATETVTADGSGRNLLMLPTLNLTDVVSVFEDGVALATTDFDWSANGYLQKVYGAWTYRLRGVTATITHGLPSLPEEVQSVIDRVAARIEGDPGVLAQVGQVRYANGPTGTAGSSLTEEDRRTLAGYRIPRL